MTSLGIPPPVEGDDDDVAWALQTAAVQWKRGAYADAIVLAVAALPALVGLSGADYQDPGAMTSGYRLGMLICAGLLALGGVISWFGLRSEESPRT